MTLILAASCLTTLCGQSVEQWVTRLTEQYPKARLLDIYKSCFQDYMGAEHLVGDIESARNYLEQELSTTTAYELLPWYYEPCGINGNYVRVSLLAVHQGKISPDVLLDAFVRSANGPNRPSVQAWADRWHEITAVIEKMGLDLPHQREDMEWIEQVLAQGRYAISHSPDYREAYMPHYRIVRRDIFEQELLPLLQSCCFH